jgi:hypothetical protein
VQRLREPPRLILHHHRDKANRWGAPPRASRYSLPASDCPSGMNSSAAELMQ